MKKSALIVMAAIAMFVADAAMANASKLRFCPDEMIADKMPWVGARATPRGYFIVKGARRELAEFDLVWVRKYCKVKTTVVQ